MQKLCVLFEVALALAKETGRSVKIRYRGYEVTVRPDDDMIDVLERWGKSAGVRLPCLLEESFDPADDDLVTAHRAGHIVPDPDPELDLADQH